MGPLMGSKAASLLAASGMATGMVFVAVCLVGFLCSQTHESGSSSVVLAVAGAARPVHVASGEHRRSVGRGAPTALSEETDAEDGLPANSGLLTALLPLSFFGASRWGLGSAISALAGSRLSSPASCRFYSVICFFQRRALSNLSGVFRL
jgi:hypothetical protein